MVHLAAADVVYDDASRHLKEPKSRLREAVPVRGVRRVNRLGEPGVKGLWVG